MKIKKESKSVPVLVTIILILVLVLTLCIGNMYAMTKENAVLIELGYVNDVMEYEKNTSRTNEGWLVSNDIKYSDFKNKMLEYMTEECYQANFRDYKDVNGYLALADFYGKTGNQAKVNKIELVTLEENLYIFSVESKGYYKQLGGDTEEYNIKLKFEVEKNESGKYVVSKYE